MSAPRVAIVGARRVRQGLGPFVARFLHERGAEVPAFLGTSASSIEEARRELERTAGIAPRGYVDLGDLLARESVDALAILSPAETHEHYLEAALEARLHVLCEKPLLWGGADLGRRARRLWEGFGERDLLLRENCQWPWALAAFHALHPDVAGEPVRSFGMLLSPASRGLQRIGDALPHPLSVLQALAPAPRTRIAGIAAEGGDPDADPLVLTFEYLTPESRIACRVEMIGGDALPRAAGLTINGRAARRRVRMADYELFLGTGDREVPLADPLRALLGDFVLDLVEARRDRVPAPAPAIPQRMEMIESVLRALREDPR